MDDTPDVLPDPAPDPAPDTVEPFDTRAAYHLALVGAIEQALAQRSREMIWMDRDFADWPLDDTHLIEALQAWLKLPGRRLVMLASEFQTIGRAHARFVHWRRDWSHVVIGRIPETLEPASFDSALVTDDGLAVALHDPTRFWGWQARSGVAARELRRRIDAYAQQSEEAFPTTVLGV